MHIWLSGRSHCTDLMDLVRDLFFIADHSHGGHEGRPSVTTEPPFTKAQQGALTATIKSALKDRKTSKRSRHHRSPTISPPSDGNQKGHRSRPSTHLKRPRYTSSYSSSSSGSSSSSTTSGSNSDSSPDHSRHHRRNRHKHGKHHHHGRAGRHQYRSHVPPVPHKVSHAIERGEFVDLSKLLTTHLGSGSSSKRSSSTRSITGLESWLEAWSIYAAVLSSHKPHLAPDLFQYQAFITRSSCRFQPYAWLQYDALFRLKMASNPGTCWSSTDPELVATWLSADATKCTSTFFSCGNPDHMSADCPLRAPPKNYASCCPVCNISGHMARDCPQLASNKQSKTSSRAKDDKYCHLYNKRGTCFRGSRCPYYHACSECNGGHPSRACPQAC